MRRPVAILCSGQGGQHAGMFDLLANCPASEPVFIAHRNSLRRIRVASYGKLRQQTCSGIAQDKSCAVHKLSRHGLDWAPHVPPRQSSPAIAWVNWRPGDAPVPWIFGLRCGWQSAALPPWTPSRPWTGDLPESSA